LALERAVFWKKGYVAVVVSVGDWENKDSSAANLIDLYPLYNITQGVPWEVDLFLHLIVDKTIPADYELCT